MKDTKSLSLPNGRIGCSFNRVLRFVFLFAGVLGLVGCSSRDQAAPAPYTVDALSFTPPAGWEITRGSDSGPLTMIRVDKAKNNLCQITVCNSVLSSGELATDFFSEWAAVVGGPFPKDVADQGNRIIGSASDVPMAGENKYVRLITYGAGTKIASIIVLAPNLDAFEVHRPKVEAFLASVTINFSVGGRPRIDLARELAEKEEAAKTEEPGQIEEPAKTQAQAQAGQDHADADLKNPPLTSEEAGRSAERAEEVRAFAAEDYRRVTAEPPQKTNATSAARAEQSEATVSQLDKSTLQSRKDENAQVQVNVAPPATAIQPTAPPGWTMQETNGGWILKPGNFGSVPFMVVVITKEHKAIGTLQEYHDGLWAMMGSPLQRSDDSRGTNGSWNIIGGKRSFLRDGKTLYVGLIALQNADRQFSVIITADSLDSLTTAGTATEPVIDSLIGGPAPVQGKKQFTFTATFPPNWARRDGPGYKGAQRLDQFGQMDRMLNLLADEPVKASLEQTFESIWDREVARLGVYFVNGDNPGYVYPEHPQPLKRRLKNGLAVWFEGRWGRIGPVRGPVRHGYLQVYMVLAEKTVSVATAIYLVDSMQKTTAADRAPVWTFLESFQSDTPIPQRPLFMPADCVGSWKMTLIKSGAYGNVEAGGTDKLDLKPDGTYSRTFASDFSSTTTSWEQNGAWTVQDSLLTLTPKSSSDQKHDKPQKQRLYSRAVLEGKVNLIVGVPDDSRLPTDVLESGTLIEMIKDGPALLRYVAHEQLE